MREGNALPHPSALPGIDRRLLWHRQSLSLFRRRGRSLGTSSLLPPPKGPWPYGCNPYPPPEEAAGSDGTPLGAFSHVLAIVRSLSSTNPSDTKKTKFLHVASVLPPVLMASRIKLDCERRRSTSIIFALLRFATHAFPAKPRVVAKRPSIIGLRHREATSRSLAATSRSRKSSSRVFAVLSHSNFLSSSVPPFSGVGVELMGGIPSSFTGAD